MNDETTIPGLVTSARSLGERFLRRQIETRTARLGDQMSVTATTILEIGEEMKQRGRAEWASDACDIAATYMDRAGTYLKKSDGDVLARDFEHYARRQPAVVAAIALTSGFALSRILRVSASAEG